MAIVSRLGKVGGWGRKPGLSVARLSRSTLSRIFESEAKVGFSPNAHGSIVHATKQKQQVIFTY